MGKKKGKKGPGQEKAAGGDGGGGGDQPRSQPGPSQQRQPPTSQEHRPGASGDDAQEPLAKKFQQMPIPSQETAGGSPAIQQHVRVGQQVAGRGQQQQQRDTTQRGPSRGQGPPPQRGRQQQQGPRPGQGPPQQGGPGPQQQQGPWPGQGPRQQGGPGPQQQQGPWPGQGPPQQRGPGPQQQGPWPGQGPPQQQQGPWPGQGPRQQGGPALQQQQGPWPGQGPPQQRGPGPQQQQAAGAGQGPPQQRQQRGPQGQQAVAQVQPSTSPSQQPTPRQSPAKQPPHGGREPTPRKGAGDSEKAAGPPTTGSGDRLLNMQLAVPGTKGRKINVESNHFTLNLGKLTTAVHYDVNIDPITPKNMLRDVMTLFQQKHYPRRNPAFDGVRNLYSTDELPFGQTISDKITVQREGRPREFKVDIQYARTVDLTPLRDLLNVRETPQSALQVIDIVLRNAPSKTCITTGRCFFTQPERIADLGEGMEMYFGFYQSAVRGWKPLLNVDVAHKAFPKEMNVIDLILDIGSDFRRRMERRDLSRGLDNYLKEKVEKFLRTLKVTYEIRGQAASRKVFRVNGLGDCARNARFKLDDGTVTNIEDYFRKNKQVNLEFPQLPTLWVGSRISESKILLPLEFCTVAAGQVLQRKMTENQTSEMIKHSATNTNRRKEKIMTAMGQANFNQDPCVREFGISVGNAFEKLDARVLQPPSLGYGGNRKTNVSRGIWRGDGNLFLKPAGVLKWTVAWADRPNPRVNANDLMAQLAKMIETQGKQSGMNLPPATQPFTPIGGRQTLQDIQGYFNTKKDFGLIFVVVPGSGPQYSFVKQAAELRVGCLTQCIKSNTLMRRLNGQTVGNILLKVNSKLNGTNHCLISRPRVMAKPCMVMGADVTHPGPDSQDIPSVAAVTASFDSNAFCYNICWRLQPPRTEIIADLAAIVKEQLLYFFKKNNGQKPQSIVFFRDGVSEGQFHQVKNAEIRALRSACTELEKGYEPKITFLVVQKRHHTRLFPTNPRDSEDKNNNVPAGTCVDSQITHRFMQDFYLVSHASIQGVAKPTKYCTLWDDNDFSNDEIEELAYHLCHMFTRCNRSVSYPAPTYYAHLAAARAKVYVENARLDMDRLHVHQQQYQILDCIVKEKPMFFV